VLRWTGALGVPSGPGAEARSGLRIVSVEPNPTRHSMRVTFVRPRSGPVRLTLCDVRGRIVGVESLPAGPPGQEVRSFAPTGQPPPGIYFVQVHQGLETATARICIF
jgi:hypothetical protein